MDDRIKQSDFVCISTMRTTFVDEKLLKMRQYSVYFCQSETELSEKYVSDGYHIIFLLIIEMCST